MGACECKNLMDFGYELNTSDKDEHSSSKKTKNHNNYNSNYKTNSKTKKIDNDISNVLSHESKNVTYNNNRLDNYNPKVQDSDFNNINNNNVNNEGLNALNSRFKNDKIQYEENDINNFQFDDDRIKINLSIKEPADNFSKYIFENINNIRENPQSFINTIEKAKSKITFDKNGICIYKSSVKVALSRGEPAFDEAIDFLKNSKPMPKLIFNPELSIVPPSNEEEIKDKTYMNEIINEKVQLGIPIKSFWRDIIKDRETCLILMIVDDTGANSGKKRNDILDPSIQSIGITSKKIGKHFASYVTLS